MIKSEIVDKVEGESLGRVSGSKRVQFDSYNYFIDGRVVDGTE